jgi:hypothetical protein
VVVDRLDLFCCCEDEEDGGCPKGAEHRSPDKRAPWVFYGHDEEPSAHVPNHGVRQHLVEPARGAYPPSSGHPWLARVSRAPPLAVVRSPRAHGAEREAGSPFVECVYCTLGCARPFTDSSPAVFPYKIRVFSDDSCCGPPDLEYNLRSLLTKLCRSHLTAAGLPARLRK